MSSGSLSVTPSLPRSMPSFPLYVSGNDENGIELDGSGSIVVYDNIGVQTADPSLALGNLGDGVLVLGSDNVIGTTSAGNNIGYNGANGVTVGQTAADTSVIQNSIRGDNIYWRSASA